jgi:hypothetical protein
MVKIITDGGRESFPTKIWSKARMVSLAMSLVKMRKG